ncbi:MAG: stage II sporulation protein P [Clostridia bacterium]|nr:stage II sporulation protein P [Clostridia bacterium]
MINVTVINMRSLVKYIIIACILVSIVWVIKPILQKTKNIDNNKISVNFGNVSFVSCIEKTLPNIKKNSEIQKIEEDVKQTTSRGSSLRRMLGIELGMIDKIIEDGEEEEIVENTPKIEQASTEVTTSQIEENNITPKYNGEYGTVKVKNESDKEITADILTPNISLENNKDVIIFHTHTCESYTPTEKFNYEMTGTYRTTDLNYTVAKVGTELENQLKSYGFNVTHDQTYHDYPQYTGSYGRSLTTVKNILASQPDTQVVIDLHRDAVGSKPEYAPCVQIGDETAAQLMFVIGTDGGGLQHLNWQDNLKYAVKVQQKANELYPGLFRPIIVRNSRYNQHLTKAATIIEVGATGNTMEQCLVSMKYLARVLNEVNK